MNLDNVLHFLFFFSFYKEEEFKEFFRLNCLYQFCFADYSTVPCFCSLNLFFDLHICISILY